jgi:hypothetical protein
MPPSSPQFNPNHLLKLNARCPICNNMYDLQKLRIIGEREQQVLAYIDCATCSTALLSILSMQPNGMTAHGLVTDLTVEEVVDSEAWKAVGADDVLDLHEFLDTNTPGVFQLRRSLN